MIAEKLLNYQAINKTKVKRIINFLCSESGSHDYTIYRNEAKKSLGLNIDKPTEGEYTIIHDIYNDIQDELQLLNPYNPVIAMGNETHKQYCHRRCLIESIEGGVDVFVSEGALDKLRDGVQAPGQPIIQHNIRDTRTFEGWKHE